MWPYLRNGARYEPKLLLITNRNSYMRFRLVPKSSTLDDLELLHAQIFSEICATWCFRSFVCKKISSWNRRNNKTSYNLRQTGNDKVNDNQRQIIIPMPHAPETGAINRLNFFPAPVSGTRTYTSCKSGTGFVWYQIPAPIRTLFYSEPESVMHVTEMIIYDLRIYSFSSYLWLRSYRRQ